MEKKSNINSFSPQNRIKEETKDKFDALLKQALNTKNRKHQQNHSASSSENMAGKSYLTQESQDKVTEVVRVDVHEAFSDDNFILNKFLKDSCNTKEVYNEARDTDEIISVDLNEPDLLFIKPPVPLPRQKPPVQLDNDNTSSSTGTYKIASAMASKHLPSSKEQSSHSTCAAKTPLATVIQDLDPEQSDASQQSQLQHFNNNEIQYVNEVQHKRKKKHRDSAETVIEAQPRCTYEKILGIMVHKTDRLKLDSLVIHPVVKIHIVNSETGEYLGKSDRNRPVVFYYENTNIAYITPIISEPYILHENRSLHPAWEETVIINEDLDFMLGNNPIIFFELMDFVSFSVANSQFHEKGSLKGWHKIAWAFLKLLGKGNSLNIDKKVCLQLYQPGKHRKVSPHICDIYHWWHEKKLLKYPASLSVTVRGMVLPEKTTETLRSKTPIHSEKASGKIFEAKENTDPEKNCERGRRSRLKYQGCKLPNRCVAELMSHDEGCLMIKFSNNGLYLACALLIDNINSIVIFSVNSYEEISRYSGHQGLIYDVTWSKDDQILVTASADCTSCVWSFTKNVFMEILPHPSYVYVSQISLNNVIATGCYDQVVRIWCNNNSDYQLTQELEGHSGYITSLCFNKKSTLLYSSDSIGVINEWKCTGGKDWQMKRELKLTDLRKTVINQILLHPRERRMLINARDSTLRIIDLKTGCALHWLQGGINNRFKMTASFSSCGSFILAGSENGYINVWNSDLGQAIASYAPYEAFGLHNLSVHCVQFHPIDNVLAVSHYGRNLPVLLVVYDGSLDGKSNVGLRILQNSNLRPKLATSMFLDEPKKVVTETEVSERLVKIRFEDVIDKIDRIVGRSNASDSARSSANKT